MWSKDRKAIEAFLGECNTGGSLAEYKYTIEEKENGDEWWEILFPVWSCNDCVQKYVLDKLSIAINIGHATMYPHAGYIKLNLYTHFCDPD